MFTDIVGYTALMGENEEKALNLVRQSKAIQQPLVEKHKGKWIKEMGNGVMAQFNSALEAVNCALEIQRISRADFDGDIRIGIHLGDITLENNDAYSFFQQLDALLITGPTHTNVCDVRVMIVKPANS